MLNPSEERSLTKQIEELTRRRQQASEEAAREGNKLADMRESRNDRNWWFGKPSDELLAKRDAEIAAQEQVAQSAYLQYQIIDRALDEATAELAALRTEDTPTVEDDTLTLDSVVVTPDEPEEPEDPNAKINKFYESIGTTTEEFGFMLDDSFGGMYDNLLDKTKDFGDVLDDAFGNIFYNIGKNLFDQYVAEPLSDNITTWLPKLFGSFEGGGYTGSGPRTGGVDGKGGFPAILHKDEIVTDLRANNAMPTPTVNIVQNMDFRNADDETVARLQAAIPQIAEAASIQIKQEIATGGEFYRFIRGA